MGIFYSVFAYATMGMVVVLILSAIIRDPSLRLPIPPWLFFLTWPISSVVAVYWAGTKVSRRWAEKMIDKIELALKDK